MNSINYDYDKNAPRSLSDGGIKKSKKQSRPLSQLDEHKSFNILLNKNSAQTYRTKQNFESIPEFPITHQPKMST